MSFVAKGPLKILLQSTGGQYLILGAGLYAVFPEQVQRFLAPFLVNYPQVTNFSSVGDRDVQHKQQPIIIQTPPTTVYAGDGGKSKRGDFGSVITYAVVAGGVCWVGYIVCINVLPDAVSQMLPVTKKFFEKTTQTLGRGILNVKEVLEEKILGVSKKQDELGKKQDDTIAKVQDISKDLSEARIDMVLLRDAVHQCQNTLDTTQRLQGYTLRGVQLLVRCITSFLPDDGEFFNEISRFIQDGDSMDHHINRRNSGKSSNSNDDSVNRKMGGGIGGGNGGSFIASPDVMMVPPIAHAVVRTVSDENVTSTGNCSINEIHAMLGS